MKKNAKKNGLWLISLPLALLLVFATAPKASASDAQATVYADTAEELQNAIASNTRIVLSGVEYTFEGNLRIFGIDNLSIIGDSGSKIVSLTGLPVVMIDGCQNIQLSNVFIGHDITAAGCGATVLMASEADNLKFENCDLYGCGSEGFWLSDTKAVFNDCIIRDCSQNIGSAMGSELVFNNCTFSNNGYENSELGYTFWGGVETPTAGIGTAETSKLTFNGCSFLNNNNTFFKSETYPSKEQYGVLSNVYSSGSTTVNSCIFSGNTWEMSEEPHIYDAVDPGASVDITNLLDGITDIDSAKKVVGDFAGTITDAQKASATGIDRMTLLIEEAAAKVSSVKISGGTICITRELVQTLEETAVHALSALEAVLAENGINTQRTPKAGVTIETDRRSFTVDKEALDSAVPEVKVRSDFATITLPVALNTEFSVLVSDTNMVKLDFTADSAATIEVSFPDYAGDTDFAAVADGNGNPMGGKYNPATGCIEAKISGSGVYAVIENEKSFDDIWDRSFEMYNAIRILASKGIINGTSKTEFSPDSSISRAEVAALIVRTLSVLDPDEDGGFSDVSRENWYFGVAGSSKKYGIINGYEDNTFRGEAVIPKGQIVAIAARVLRTEMGYKIPANVSDYLTYSDESSIADWAREDVALATIANLVPMRADGSFIPTGQMTRGDAAIILYRLYMKLW